MSAFSGNRSTLTLGGLRPCGRATGCLSRAKTAVRAAATPSPSRPAAAPPGAAGAGRRRRVRVSAAGGDEGKGRARNAVWAATICSRPERRGEPHAMSTGLFRTSRLRRREDYRCGRRLRPVEPPSPPQTRRRRSRRCHPGRRRRTPCPRAPRRPMHPAPQPPGGSGGWRRSGSRPLVPRSICCSFSRAVSTVRDTRSIICSSPKHLPSIATVVPRR